MDPARWKEVSRIAADCMELEGARRREHLDRACGDDLELRAEVERLLEAHEGHDALLDAAAAGQTASIAPSTSATSTDTGAWSPTSTFFGAGRLPAELMERAGRRMGMVSALYAVGLPVAYTIHELALHVFGGNPYEQPPHTAGQIIVAAFALLAARLAWATRHQSLEGRNLIRGAIAAEIVGSFGIALVSYGNLSGGPVWGVSWLCIWIMMFPFVIPLPAWPAVIAAFVSAAMGPAAVLTWALAGHAPPPTSTILAATFPNFVVAALAVLGAQQMYHVGVELGAAKRLGRYRLVSPLGHGGMGEIWKAEHDLLARPAALKLIRPKLLKHGRPTQAVLERFEREAQATAALTSPHTVKLYDFGVTEDGLFYYVMELLEGLDLEALVHRHGALSPARAIHFLRQACASLSEAHALGLIHRDIKPSNLFACRQGLELDFLKVLDFGIVRAASSPGDAESEKRMGVEGTPAFMAPEAMHGIASAATDLYSLGCVARWFLTKERAGDGDGHAIGRPRPMGAAVPPALRTIIESCLEPDPSRRPQSAARLDTLLAQVPIPAWDQTQAEAWWQAHAIVAPAASPSRLAQ